VKKKAVDKNPYKQIARYLRAVEPLVADAGEGRELVDALHSLSNYLAKTPSREIEEVIMRRPVLLERGWSGQSLSDLSLLNLEKLILSGKLPRRELELIANERFGVPIGSMRSFSRVEYLVRKLLSLIENEKTHQTIDAAAKRSLE